MLLHQYLEESALRWGDKTAVKYKNESMSYHQLDIFSNQIAHSLLSGGVRPGATVGLYLAKSMEVVAAIFGILKAGAVYVPIDPDSPPERTRYIISNCRIETMMVDELKLQKLGKNWELFPEKGLLLNLSRNHAAVPQLAPAWQVWSREDIEKQLVNAPGIEPRSEDDLAYILYTSGSTGQPKGVMLTHRNGNVFVEWAANYLGLGADDVFSSHAPFHFDLSIFDLFVSLKLGGTLCLIPPGISYFPDAILRFIFENQLTVWYSVPSALIQLLLLQDDVKEKLKSIKTLIYAGEVFPYSYLNQLAKVLTDAGIYNFYGPTETNVITYYSIKLRPDELLEENVPIGEPCPYARIAIVDEHQQPVGPGTPGELIVNGSSLMKGYWDDPQKSARAIQKVILDGQEDFFYCTGDLVVQRADGNIVYVNRRDNMVKTRGFRVELGEVETALYKHPAILKAAVVAVPDETVGHRLAAFIALQDGAILSPDEMDKHCSRFLPAYMIPEKTIFLPQLPLSANGKIDREKLKSTLSYD